MSSLFVTLKTIVDRCIRSVAERLHGQPSMPDSPECLELIKRISENGKPKELENHFNKLSEQDARMMIEYFEKVLRSPSLKGDKGKILILFCRLVSATKYLPQSYRLGNIKYDRDLVGEGGSATVYKGKWKRHAVCLKVPKSTVENPRPHEINKLDNLSLKELVLWAHFSHPNVLPLYGVISVGNKWSPVSPWMEHGNLNDYLFKNRDISRAQLVRIYFFSCMLSNEPVQILEILSGLAYLHNMNVVHGDLKSFNILVSSNRHALITDFGLSKASTTTSAGFTDPGESFSGRWTAPEMLTEEGPETAGRTRPTKAGDIWGIACLIYEVMSRQVPYFQFTILQVMAAIHRKETPQRPDGEEPDFEFIEDGLWKLLESCWNFTPKERPNCQEVLVQFRKLYPQCRLIEERSQEMQISRSIRSKAGVRVDIDKVHRLLREVPLPKSRAHGARNGGPSS
ncbi:Abelson tyrosine-protein kinase 2 [Leucoagaricus sp. SymC.cos]|nr:Abelson tyrosine-protein kinase 2 [Leucoagaricus sp. SymC.cos]